MVKKLLLSAATAVVALSAFAQGTDRQKMGSFSHSNYPQVKVAIGQKNYVVLQDGEPARAGNVAYENANIGNKTMTKQLNKEGADLYFNFSNMRDFRPIDVERYDPRYRSSRINQTASEGVHRPRPGFACAFMDIELSYYITVSKPDGTVLYENFVSETGSYNSSWWPTEAGAVDSVQRVSKGQTMAALISRNNHALAQLVGASYMMNFRGIHCYKAEPKRKQPDTYGEINEAVDKLMRGGELIKLNEYDIESFKEVTEGCVEIWEKELKTKNLTDKTARINAEIACGLNYDLGLYYLFCKEFKKAGKYFKEVVMVDKRFGDAKFFVENCDKWQLAKDAYERMMAAE